MKPKCPECGGNVEKKTVPFKVYGIEIGKFPAEVCAKCGEEVFSAETFKKIKEKTMEKGLWGLESKTTAGKVGNSIDVRISKKLADFVNLKKGEEVRIYPADKHKLVIEV